VSELDDILQGEEPEEKTPEAPEEKVEEAESDEAQKDEADAEAEEKPAEASDEGEEKPKKPREQRSVPLAAFLEVQNKLKAELDAKDKRLAELEAKQKAQPDWSTFIKKPPEEVPSVLDDEKGYHDALRQTQSADLSNLKFQISLDNALVTFGEEKVNAAILAFQEAAKTNPLLIQAADNSRNPVREIVQWHDDQQRLSYAQKLQADHLRKIAEAGGLDAYEKTLRAQIEAELKAAMETQADDEDEEAPPAQKQKPMPSNFNKGGKGGNKSVPADSSLEALLR